MDFAAAADMTAEMAELVIERVGVEPGIEVLDVACGTGNAAIPAARAGARVTGLDPSADLLAIARERAADAMVEVDWVQADTRELPFADRSFDRVVSVLVVHDERAVGELRRVCRGRIGVCCWTPTGAIGRMVETIAELVPPPPGSASPLLWGTEEHVRELLGDARFERREIEWRDSSVETCADFMLESFGPLLNAQEILGERAGELRTAFTHWLAAANLEDDGTLRFRGEYLVSIVDC